MEKMTLLDFMVFFLNQQDKHWLIREILSYEAYFRNQPSSLESWERLADNCQIEIVNEEKEWENDEDE